MNPQTSSRSVTGISPNILSGMDGRGELCGINADRVCAYCGREETAAASCPGCGAPKSKSSFKPGKYNFCSYS